MSVLSRFVVFTLVWLLVIYSSLYATGDKTVWYGSTIIYKLNDEKDTYHSSTIFYPLFSSSFVDLNFSNKLREERGTIEDR